MHSSSSNFSRRSFLRSASLLAAGTLASRWPLLASSAPGAKPLEEFHYGDISLASDLHNRQLHETISVLMALSDDSLLKPFRQMAGQPAPGQELGGWYLYDPEYKPGVSDAGFAPGATFGQWVSALARTYATTGDSGLRQRVLRLNRLYAQTISPAFCQKTRFPAYTYDKLVCGLIDSHQYAADPNALAILNHTTDIALPHLPGKAITRGQSWRPGTDDSYTWDESYTLPENLFLAYHRGAGERYRKLAVQYLDESYFGPLAENRNVFAGRHAYSYVNALSSAAQAYLTLSDEKYLRAASNGFAMLQAQSYATGGWGPDETLLAPDSTQLLTSLSNTHNSFETPCGSYAHFKLTRYLLRITRDSRYGDSMERMMYNTVLGAKPLQRDGRAFYYSDYNFNGQKSYSNHRWPCCSGTLPQVAADYGINAYFRDPQGIYVNLYIPSSLKWKQDSASATLTQETGYPFESLVRLRLSLTQSRDFSVNLRIPAWTQGASLSINGKKWPDATGPGTFATIKRVWKDGDRIELDIPLARRLEPIDAQHPETAALLEGPLVLFPIGEASPVVTSQQLLAARKIGPETWQAEIGGSPLRMLPFTSIEDQRYTTYLKISKERSKVFIS